MLDFPSVLRGPVNYDASKNKGGLGVGTYDELEISLDFFPSQLAGGEKVVESLFFVYGSCRHLENGPDLTF